MWYYIVDYIPFENGWMPVLPAETSFMLLAAPHGDPPRWGIFQVWAEVPPSEQVREIEDQLREIILSGERYPPALALAREESSAGFDGRVPSRQEFCRLYGDIVIEHMRRQAQAPYVLVEAVGEESMYLTRGQFYWVLRYLRGSGGVQWVSADYFIYENPASDFALSEEQLSNLLLPFPAAV